MNKKLNYKLCITILLLLLIAFAISSMLIGRYSLSAQDSFKILMSKMGISNINKTWTDLQESVITTIRMPRVLTAIFVGAGLSVAGASFQGIFHNPLVSPDILGVSASAGFGAALGIIIGSQTSSLVSILAFTFGIVGVGSAYFLSRVHKTTPTVMMVLSGVVVSSLANAGISILKYFADPLEQLPAITFWLMGSLDSVRLKEALIAIPVISICLTILFLLGFRIDLLSMGENEAKSLGVRPERLKALVIITSTLISAISVYICGTIGWIGLIIPHVSRMLVGPSYRKLLPTAALLGGMFLLFIDDLVRTISESSLPLSIVISLVGAPFFAALLRKTKGEWI
ncbi:MAG: FecCD family ABC transporter permease [Peptoanaerobacter stomatis]|uniref:FecCD family ABC transporter permease n=1 Tax=Peptoanaerobacter stomatis TaxID=796937 RepID=UPI003FA18A11